MKKRSNSRSAFFNPRVLIGFVLCSIGVSLALAGFSKSVTGMSTTATAQPPGTNPVPLINQPLVPDATAPGGPDFILTVNGTGFVSGSIVNWNGSARATTFVSGSQLRATITAADVAESGTGSVTVASPSWGASNLAFFQITTPTSGVPLSRTDYGTGLGPYVVIAGDFNGDGILDLATDNVYSNSISVLLGNGDGTFQAQMDFPAGQGPSSIATGDFNGDGKLDLVVSNYSIPYVSVVLGNGDGTFQQAIDYPTGGTLQNIVIAADFDGDGNLDLATTNENNNTVSVLLGNGDGTFRPNVDYATGFQPTGVTTGDFNRDGALDLTVSNHSSQNVSVLLGNGDGSFQNAVNYDTAVGSHGLTTADLNGDGKLDLAVDCQVANMVSILLGNGDGTFQPHVDYDTGSSPVGVTSGDFNGDGKLDLAVVDSNFLGGGSPALSILLGNGDGTFGPRTDYETALLPLYPAAGDFNGDGRLDLAVTNQSSNTVGVFLQTTEITLSTTKLTFGVQTVGTTSLKQEVTLTNIGVIPLAIAGIATSGDFLQKNDCGTSLPAGASCTIKVAFSPSAKGARIGSVTITDDAADSPQTIKLTGTGTVVQLSPSALNFGDQIVGTTSDPQTATVTNVSSEDLHISEIGLGGANFGDFAETTTCGSNLAAGGSCTIDVTFTPTAKGHRHAKLLITDDGGGSPQSVPLKGTGVLH